MWEGLLIVGLDILGIQPGTSPALILLGRMLIGM
jgi:hypothetical protein